LARWQGAHVEGRRPIHPGAGGSTTTAQLLPVGSWRSTCGRAGACGRHARRRHAGSPRREAVGHLHHPTACMGMDHTRGPLHTHEQQQHEGETVTRHSTTAHARHMAVHTSSLHHSASSHTEIMIMCSSLSVTSGMISKGDPRGWGVPPRPPGPGKPGGTCSRAPYESGVFVDLDLAWR
jgi:hypothetical protein